VLGPRLILDTADLTDVAKEHRVTIHSFADDTQLYLHCCHDDTASTIIRLEHCIQDINQWMAGNRLKLNIDKTELLWAGTRRLLQDFTFPSLQLAVDVITPKQHARVLGVVISADLSLVKHVTNVSVTCFHHLCQLLHIRRMLTVESAATLVHASVTSRVDYCNVVLDGSLKVITNKLSRVMNVAARILAGTRKFDRSLTQLMHDNLHWLDVPQRVKYKAIILTRHCLISTVPHYLAADCVPVSEMTQRCYLRSAAGYQLVVRSFGLRVFSVLGPRLWNSLPRLLRNTNHNTTSFGHSLKTYFLSEY